jgi:hypothetical protein
MHGTSWLGDWRRGKSVPLDYILLDPEGPPLRRIRKGPKEFGLVTQPRTHYSPVLGESSASEYEQSPCLRRRLTHDSRFSAMGIDSLSRHGRC